MLQPDDDKGVVDMSKPAVRQRKRIMTRQGSLQWAINNQICSSKTCPGTVTNEQIHKEINRGGLHVGQRVLGTLMQQLTMLQMGFNWSHHTSIQKHHPELLSMHKKAVDTLQEIHCEFRNLEKVFAKLKEFPFMTLDDANEMMMACSADITARYRLKPRKLSPDAQKWNPFNHKLMSLLKESEDTVGDANNGWRLRAISRHKLHEMMRKIFRFRFTESNVIERLQYLGFAVEMCVYVLAKKSMFMVNEYIYRPPKEWESHEVVEWESKVQPRGNRKKRKKKEEEAQKVDDLVAKTRKIKWRSTCSTTALNRLSKARKQNMAAGLCARSRTSHQWRVDNGEGKMYMVRIGTRHCCSCQDWKFNNEQANAKGTRKCHPMNCKHIMWVCLNKYRLSEKNPLVWQIGWDRVIQRQQCFDKVKHIPIESHVEQQEKHGVEWRATGQDSNFEPENYRVVKTDDLEKYEPQGDVKCILKAGDVIFIEGFDRCYHKAMITVIKDKRDFQRNIPEAFMVEFESKRIAEQMRSTGGQCGIGLDTKVKTSSKGKECRLRDCCLMPSRMMLRSVEDEDDPLAGFLDDPFDTNEKEKENGFGVECEGCSVGTANNWYDGNFYCEACNQKRDIKSRLDMLIENANLRLNGMKVDEQTDEIQVIPNEVYQERDEICTLIRKVKDRYTGLWEEIQKHKKYESWIKSEKRLRRGDMQHSKEFVVNTIRGKGDSLFHYGAAENTRSKKRQREQWVWESQGGPGNQPLRKRRKVNKSPSKEYKLCVDCGAVERGSDLDDRWLEITCHICRGKSVAHKVCCKGQRWHICDVCVPPKKMW